MFSFGLPIGQFCAYVGLVSALGSSSVVYGMRKGSSTQGQVPENTKKKENRELSTEVEQGNRYPFLYIPPPKSRYELLAPLPYLPATMLDTYAANSGVAQEFAQRHNLQARIFWIDCTANLERVNSEEKIVVLVKKIKDAGFNTIVYDIKPIVGYTVYPSKFTKKIEEWRGQKLPKDFDPLKFMVHEAKKNQIALWVNLDAFSEGHSMFHLGPGYMMPDLQTVLYDSVPALKAGSSENQSFALNITPDEPLLDEQKIYIYTDLKAIPDQGNLRLVIDPLGYVKQVIVSGETLDTLPKECVVFVGKGNGERFLKEHGELGKQFKITSLPLFVKISERPKSEYPLMMNLHRPEVRERELQFIREVLENYKVDGVVYDDRLRYAGLDADFSEYTRAEFEKYVDARVEWPRDVFEYTYTTNLKRGIRPGKFWDAWWTWRALTIRNWVARVRNEISRIHPKTLFGIYVGSWYGDYSKYGSNYASDELRAGFNFLTESYRCTGFAGLLDFVITGCYYSTPTMYSAMEGSKPLGHSVEAAARLSNSVVRDQAWTYAGIRLSAYWSNPKSLEDVLQAASWNTQGIMVFDLSHKIELFWDIFERAFKNDLRRAPHSDSKFLEEVRKLRSTRDRAGVLGPPVIIQAGINGVGF